jgi:NAD(P)-dependent dehydrogenase (short-subunit alcohol dehydrogenase family)
MLNGNGSFAGRVAFVTGAANGIGRDAAPAFAPPAGASGSCRSRRTSCSEGAFVR